MTFANPWGLLGLLSLPTILALHLLHQRQRHYYVSNLSLWSFLEAEVRGSRFHRIPLSWLLILDLSIGLILSLVLAQPRLNLSLPIRNARHVVILLDVSTSMRARDVTPSRFSQAIIETTALLNSLGPRDVATILTFGVKPRQLADTRRDEMKNIFTKISSLQVGETGHTLLETLAMGVAGLDNQLPAEFHIFTDGAIPEITDAGLINFAYPIQWHLVGKDVENQAVLEIATTNPDENHLNVFSSVGNFSAKISSRVVTLLVDGDPVDSTVLDLPPDSIMSQSWELSGSPTVVSVLLASGDYLKEDDVATIGLHDEKTLVTLVTTDAEPIQKAIQALPNAILRTVAPNDYSPHLPSDLTIFRGTFPEAWPEGLVLIVEPTDNRYAREKKAIPANAPLKTLSPDPIIEGVDFSGVRWSHAWVLKKSTFETFSSEFIPIIEVDDTPLLLSGEVENISKGNTKVILLMADLMSGNFTKHPAFPIFFGKLVESARSKLVSNKIHTGEPIVIPNENLYHTLRILPPEGTAIEYQAQWPHTWDQTQNPGEYWMELENKAGKKFNYMIGVNAGDVTESDLRPRQWMKNITVNTKPSQVQTSQETNIAPWLLLLGIILLFMEATLAWR